MKFKAIIFDMDGTIIDSGDAWKQATRNLVEFHGVEYTLDLHNEINKYVVGAGLVESCRVIKDVAKINETVENLMSKKTEIVSQLLNKNLVFIPGFTNFHKELTQQTLKSGLATNADDHTLMLAKKALNLEKFFGEHMYNVSHVEKPKPHPDLYLHAADQLKEKAHECIAVEDSEIGLAAAKAAGMFCIGINTGKDLKALKEADLIIEEYKDIDLKNILKKL